MTKAKTWHLIVISMMCLVLLLQLIHAWNQSVEVSKVEKEVVEADERIHQWLKKNGGAK